METNIAEARKLPERKFRRVLREPQVREMVNLSTQVMYAGISEGWFPAPLRLTPGGGAVGWFEDEVLEWLESLPRSVAPGVKPWTSQKSAKAAAPTPAGSAPAPVPKRLSANGKPIGRPSRAMLDERARQEAAEAGA